MPSRSGASPTRWFNWRNRLLASARFRRLGGRFPLTRLVRRPAGERCSTWCRVRLFAGAAACVRLRLFDHPG
jgi:hypothetical protein